MTDEAWRTEAADVLVIGQGVAGLLAAHAAAESGARVLVAGLGNGASSWLQGVNVPLGHADPRDTPDMLAADITREGYGLSDPELVRATAAEAPEVFDLLVSLGVEFAVDGGVFRQRHASGSTYPRCCFVHSAMWGPVTIQALRSDLRKRRNVALVKAHLVRLLRDGERVIGAAGYEPRTGNPLVLAAPRVVLASGGVGGLYEHSTYPSDVFGSSYAMAFHAGAVLTGMEFIQFEPLVAFEPKPIRGYVMPTTMFGDGATLRDASGLRFLLETRPEGEAGIGKEELVYAMAEMVRVGRAASSGAVWFDARPIPEKILEGYPWFWRFFRKHAIDPTREMIEVLPAAHTCLGGIKVDVQRRTTVPGLFAAGEAAAGIHGAGRLAGGSGTDVIVSGHRAGLSAASDSAPAAEPRAALALARSLFAGTGRVPGGHYERSVRRARAIMSSAAGLWRDETSLSAALIEIRDLFESCSGPVASPASVRLALQDRLTVSGMILESALARRESRGAHQRLDHRKMAPGPPTPTMLPWRPAEPFTGPSAWDAAAGPTLPQRRQA